LKTGSAYYAPAASAVQMAKAILKDEKRYLPCAVYLQGEYGIENLFCGVLAKLGARGLEGIPVLELNTSEKAALQRSAESVRELVVAMKKLGVSA